MVIRGCCWYLTGPEGLCLELGSPGTIGSPNGCRSRGHQHHPQLLIPQGSCGCG